MLIWNGSMHAIPLEGIVEITLLKKEDNVSLFRNPSALKEQQKNMVIYTLNKKTEDKGTSNYGKWNVSFGLKNYQKQKHT